MSRIALITGATSGIGKATAEAFANEGIQLILCGRRQDRLNELQTLLGSKVKVLTLQFDVRDREAVFQAIESLPTEWQAIDILVNNAGLEKAGALRKLSESDWDITIDVNLKGTFLCAQAVHAGMVERKHGRIINIASRAWLGGPGQIPYSSAKAGVVGMTRALALELGKNGVTTNCVAPGLIHTPMWDGLPEKDRNFLLTKQPTGRLGTVDNIADAVLFLADDDASFINGQVLYVCGGRSLFAG